MPGVSVCGATPFLAAQLSRRLEEVEPLELHAGHDLEAHLLGALEHPLERLARALGMRRAVGVDEVAEEERHVGVPRHVARGVQVEPRQRVGKAVLPAGGGGVVVGDIHHVPAQHHVAEAEAAGRVGLGGAEELVDVQVLAAQHAVDVADRDLDLGCAGQLDALDGRVLSRRVLLRMWPWWYVVWLRIRTATVSAPAAATWRGRVRTPLPARGSAACGPPAQSR